MSKLRKPKWLQVLTVVLLCSTATLAYAVYQKQGGADWEGRYLQMALAPISAPETTAPERTAVFEDPRLCGEDAGGARLSIGDRITAQVYELLAGGAPAGGEVIFERSDLTLTSEVDAAGVIRFGPLGRVDAFDVTLDCLSQRLAERFEEGYGARARVALKIEERSQVFVTGEVGTPGAYPHSTGLTVDQLLSIAGRSAALDPVRRAEIRARIDMLEQGRARALLTEARLRAENRGSRTLALPARERAWVVETLGEEALEFARRQLAASLSAHELALSHAKANIEDLRAIIAATEVNVEVLKGQATGLRNSADRLSGLIQRGVALRERLDATISRQMQAERDIHAAMTAEVEFKKRLRENEATLTSTRLQRETAIAAQLEETRAQRRSAELELAGLRQISQAANLETLDKLRFTLRRRTPDGYAELKADPQTVIRPGDLLRVEHGALAMRDAAATPG